VVGVNGAGTLQLRSGVEWQHVDDEVVVLDLGSSSYLAVNDTGALLWPLIAAGTTEVALVDEVMARFGLDAEQARADVGAFVDRLRTLALVDER
jgi:hypothetical protein